MATFKPPNSHEFHAAAHTALLRGCAFFLQTIKHLVGWNSRAAFDPRLNRVFQFRHFRVFPLLMIVHDQPPKKQLLSGSRSVACDPRRRLRHLSATAAAGNRSRDLRTRNPQVVDDKLLRTKQKRRHLDAVLLHICYVLATALGSMLVGAIAEIKICGSPTRARTWDLRINSPSEKSPGSRAPLWFPRFRLGNRLADFALISPRSPPITLFQFPNPFSPVVLSDGLNFY